MGFFFSLPCSLAFLLIVIVKIEFIFASNLLTVLTKDEGLFKKVEWENLTTSLVDFKFKYSICT